MGHAADPALALRALDLDRAGRPGHRGDVAIATRRGDRRESPAAATTTVFGAVMSRGEVAKITYCAPSTWRVVAA
jgi:hypothetical protein